MSLHKTLIRIQLQGATCIPHNDYGRKGQKSNHSNMHGRYHISDSKPKIIVQTINRSIKMLVTYLHKKTTSLDRRCCLTRQIARYNEINIGLTTRSLRAYVLVH